MVTRTYLFVPGNRPERFAKALASGADAIVLDLEDAVAPVAKGDARDAIARWAGSATQAERERVVVRINDAGASAFAEDLRLLSETRLAQVMLPKAESAAQINELVAAIPSACVLPLVETAQGIAKARELAASASVSRLIFGTLDFALDLDLHIEDSSEALVYAAGCLAVASRIAGIDAPVAGVTPQLDDEERLLSDLAWARRHGFGAKLCIHPRQVAAIHAALAPSPSELDWARRVLAAEAASPGAAQLDGRMIDRPVIRQATRTLQRAKK
ncbi:MAG TPA: CoA ester lyase [Burkholderiaceae bacterium]|nr:CoA ester lyase [Burkholderiaceae bacterium]